MHLVQVIMVTAAAGAGLVWTVILIVDYLGNDDNPDPGLDPGPVISLQAARMLAELDVREENQAFVGRLTDRFLRKNPQEEKAFAYARSRKSVISQVRVMAGASGVDESEAESVGLALGQGDTESMESLVGPDGNGWRDVVAPATLSEGQMLLRGHLAILVDRPRAARRFFEIVAERRAETDVRGARDLLADAGDNLAGLGCVLGSGWLEAAIDLYDASLSNWPKEDRPVEWAIVQNNRSAALMSVGIGHADKERAMEVLRRGVDGLNDAGEVFGLGWNGSLESPLVVALNLDRALEEMLSLKPHELALQQERAVAARWIISTETRVLQRGGEREELERLVEGSGWMLIESTRQATEARRLSLRGEPKPCPRPSKGSGQVAVEPRSGHAQRTIPGRA